MLSKKTRTGAVLAAVAAITPTIASSASDPADAREATPRRQQAPGDVDAAELYTRAIDVDIAEARRRLASQEGLNAALGELRALAGDQFGGAWIEHEPDYRGVVRLTGPVGDRAAFDAAVAASPAPIDVRADATRSMAELQAEQVRVQEELDQTLPGAATGIHEQTGSVTVYAPAPTQASREASRAAMPEVRDATDAPVRVRYDESDVSLQHDYGGDRMDGCTTGFTIWDHGTGQDGILSAGHCGAPQTYLGYNGETYPLTRQAWWASGVTDVAIYTSTHVAVPREFYTSPTNRLSLSTTSQAWIPWASQSVGTLVCHHGRTTGNSCGFITDRASTICAFPPCDPNWVRVEGPFTLACAGGDSGGPWYDNINDIQAFGIHHGGSWSGSAIGQCNYALYTPIDHKVDIGATLLLG